MGKALVVEFRPAEIGPGHNVFYWDAETGTLVANGHYREDFGEVWLQVFPLNMSTIKTDLQVGALWLRLALTGLGYDQLLART